jgi:hypothetical protein
MDLNDKYFAGEISNFNTRIYMKHDPTYNQTQDCIPIIPI